MDVDVNVNEQEYLTIAFPKGKLFGLAKELFSKPMASPKVIAVTLQT